MVLYRRNKTPGGLYFFTVTLKNRSSQLLTEHINLLKNAMQKTKTELPFKTQAIVVLPDHIHAIWQLPENETNYSSRWRRIKSEFTHQILRTGVKLTKDKRGEYDLWQRRFWEHTIRDEGDLENHINYIHYNPVKHRLVKNVWEWEFSSFHAYIKKGMLPSNWGASERQVNGNFGE